jgi:hypothetical protein
MSPSQPPQPSAAPEPVEPDAVLADGETAEVEADAPLNRAARRAKARQAGPAHVGPRDELERRIRGAGGGRKRKR